MSVPAAIEGVSVREFARKIGVSHVTVLRWLRDGYITRRPDGLIDPVDAERRLAEFGLPRQRFETGGAGGEIRMTLSQAIALPSSAEAEAAVAEVVDDLLRPSEG